MKTIIEYKDGTIDYKIGDVVYLWDTTCEAVAVENDNGNWTFKPLIKQSYYLEHNGLIPFHGKPSIFAKQTEIKEDQP